MELLVFLRVGINGHFGRCGTDGVNKATLNDHIAISVNSVVVTGTRIEIAIRNVQVLRRVDAVVVCLNRGFTTCDIEIILTLDSFGIAARCGDIQTAAADVDATIADGSTALFILVASLDAFCCRIVFIVDPIGVGSVVRVFGAVAVIVIKATCGRNRNVTSADVQYVVAFHTLAARSSGFEGKSAAADVDVAVGTQSTSGIGLLVS